LKFYAIVFVSGCVIKIITFVEINQTIKSMNFTKSIAAVATVFSLLLASI